MLIKEKIKAVKHVWNYYSAWYLWQIASKENSTKDCNPTSQQCSHIARHLRKVVITKDNLQNNCCIWNIWGITIQAGKSRHRNLTWIVAGMINEKTLGNTGLELPLETAYLIVPGYLLHSNVNLDRFSFYFWKFNLWYWHSYSGASPQKNARASFKFE